MIKRDTIIDIEHHLLGFGLVFWRFIENVFDKGGLWMGKQVRMESNYIINWDTFKVMLIMKFSTM